MGQKENARAIIEQQYEFVAHTTLDMNGVRDAAQRAMDASQSRLKGRIEEIGLTYCDAGNFGYAYALKGPGGSMAMTIMDIGIEGRPAGPGDDDIETSGTRNEVNGGWGSDLDGGSARHPRGVMTSRQYGLKKMKGGIRWPYSLRF